MNPDVILLDLHLGDIDGIDVHDALRRDAATAHVPVVIVTSRNMSEAERERLGPGTPVLSKANLTRDEVQAAMQRAIEHTLPPAAGTAEPS